MKKVCLALLVLAITVPTMAAVNITLVKGTEANSVILGYNSTSGEVRAFALDLTVSGGALLTSTIQRLGGVQGHDSNYYVTPTNVGFTSMGTPSVLRAWPYNSPAVDASVNGFTAEMASLYAVKDPCVAHRFAPPASGNLIKFFVDAKKCSWDGKITITVTGANAKRGKVVLKGPPPTSVDPVLPAPLVLTFECVQIGKVCGGVQIGPTEYANWVSIGKPMSWCHPGHYLGDSNVDCLIDSTDLLDDTYGWATAWAGTYVASADCNDDLIIDTTDLLGWGTEQNGWAYAWNVVGTVPPPCDPGILP